MSFKNIHKCIALTLIILLGFFIFTALCHANSGLVVNEIVARDPNGGNDWIELFVVGNEAVNLGNYSLLDDSVGRQPAPLPDMILAPGQFIVIQAADTAPGNGAPYVPFKLSSNDCVTLYLDSNSVDALDWNDGDAPEGNSYGRLPDGIGAARTLIPTPNLQNEAPPGTGPGPIPSSIESVSPVFAAQGAIGVMVTITLSQDMAMLPPAIIPSSVKIGSLEGQNIVRNGLSITALFNIPVNELPGMKDVSVTFPPPPNAPQPMIITKTSAFEIQAGGGQPPGPGPQLSTIENVSPSQATQGDGGVMVTITLSQDMAMLPPAIIPSSVKIGSLGGSNISRNGVLVTAVFDIPVNEPTGIKDVSVALPPSPMDPNAQSVVITRTGAFEIVRGYVPFTIGATTTDEIVTDIPTFSPGGLYDEGIVRTIYLEFKQENWWQQLENNYVTEVNIPADLTMDGNTYHEVGVRFKGMTSYMMAGNSQKKSFNIEMDANDPDQRLMGYRTLNLNNAALDPSFVREVLYFKIFRKYAPCPQANFVKLVINGENWGIYNNAQQQNAEMINEWFKNNDGDRWKVGMATGQGGGFFIDGNFPQFSLADWLASPMARDLNNDGQINEEDFTIFNTQGGFFIPILQTLAEWLAGPATQDLNNDGQIDEIDYDIYIHSQTITPGGVWGGDPNMIPPGGGWGGGGWGGGGMFDPNFIPMQIPFAQWAASPMARDLNNDGQINEADYTIFINSMQPPTGGGMWGDPNMILPGGWGDPNMIPPGGGMWIGDPNMMQGGGGMMMGGGNGALTWLGSDVAAYQQAYELKSEHTADPWARLIHACDILNNTPLEQLANVADDVLAVDRWLWFLAMENIFTDEDSYLTKGWDYQIYYDPETGQIHPLQHDGNETFDNRFVNQSPFAGETYPSRPVISKLLAIPQFRKRYLAHIRTIIQESFDWNLLAPQVEAYRNLIANEVMADTRKLYSYDQFVGSFTDLQNFVNNRRTYLLNQPDINQSIPAISSVERQVIQAGTTTVLPGQPAWIIAEVQGVSAIEQVILHYTSGKGPFEQVSMFFADVNGNAGGNDILVAEIPPFHAGSMVRYYIEVRTASTVEGNSFAPYNAEDYVYAYRVFTPIADYTPIVINELMARNQTTIHDPQGDYEDWIELFNVSSQEVDLSGMYLSDNEDNPLKWEIPAGTTLAPGGYLIVWADEDGGDTPGLHASFKLATDGEKVSLVDTDAHGNFLLDSILFGQQQTDVSFGRALNGTGQFHFLSGPTPDGYNLPAIEDGDGDGYTPEEGDYNDANPAINPVAVEVCDGIDNNCDGLVDEGFNNDSDWYTTCAGDCDDNNPAVHPEAIEVYDGLDNDCDGFVDLEGVDIGNINPSYALLGDTDLLVTITLATQTQMLPVDLNLISVMIGTIAGRNINRNGLQITALFDIPVNGSVGMKDISVEFQPFNLPGIFITKSDVFKIRAGGSGASGNNLSLYNTQTWYALPDNYTPQTPVVPGAQNGYVITPQGNLFMLPAQNWTGFTSPNWSGSGQQNQTALTPNWFVPQTQPWNGFTPQNQFGSGLQSLIALTPQNWFMLQTQLWNGFTSPNWLGTGQYNWIGLNAPGGYVQPLYYWFMQ